MKKFVQRALAALKDESGQGATEYILLLVVVVAVVLMFKGKIMTMLEGKLGELNSGLEQVNTSTN